MNRSTILAASVLAALSTLTTQAALALPGATDRVYTADQNTNTISVFSPSSNTLLGQIKLGNVRPDVLSPLYRGEINVHGLGFSPDHKTIIAIANGSNSVTFIDTATNKVKGKTYVGRSPHEGFFSADGKEVWVVVRGEDYISVIDPATFRETRRIQTDLGPGMVQFLPDGKLAFVVSSFTPTVDVIDVKTYQVIKRIPVVSPFSPFLQFTPDFHEMWMTHKDVGKVTRIDTRTLAVTGVIDTGFISNHLAFASVGGKVRAYVTIGGENVVKVYSTDKEAKLLATIPTGALPHGIWSADDGSRLYVGLENGDGVDVLDPALNRIVAHMPGGQAPQALLYLSGVAANATDAPGLVARVNNDSVNITLKANQANGGEGRGFVVARSLGVVDALEVSLFKLKPDTQYSVYLRGQQAPVGAFKTDAKGAANGTMIGPVRAPAVTETPAEQGAGKIIVMEGTAPAPDPDPPSDHAAEHRRFQVGRRGRQRPRAGSARIDRRGRRIRRRRKESPHAEYESADAPIAPRYYPYNRCEVSACRECGRHYLRYSEAGGYFTDARIRTLQAALLIDAPLQLP